MELEACNAGLDIDQLIVTHLLSKWQALPLREVPHQLDCVDIGAVALLSLASQNRPRIETRSCV